MMIIAANPTALCFLFVLILPTARACVPADTLRFGSGGDTLEVHHPPPVEFLGRSFIDVFSNGRMQGTAQLLRLRIGEPEGFSLPLYVFVGASGDGLGVWSPDENTISNLLNPVGGLLNGTIAREHRLFQTRSGITSLQLTYQGSIKLISAQDSSGSNTFLGSSYGNAGLFFRTGAWDSAESGNLGTFWVHARAILASETEPGVFSRVFDEPLSEEYLWGYALDFGLEINRRINLKAGIYQFLNNQQVGLLRRPTFKFSLDYNLRRT